jgi:hypothetical protein
MGRRIAVSTRAGASIASMGCFLLVLSGCQAVPEPGSLLSAEIFEDIPAPATARVQTADAVSFSYRSESFRCAKYVYEYPGGAAEAVAFFHDVMVKPPYSWDLHQEADLRAGHALMNFRKGEDRCTVDVRGRERHADGAEHARITICVNYQ